MDISLSPYYMPSSIAAALFLVLLYHYYSYKTNVNRRHRFAPQPAGALPIIGHLHLLAMGGKPAIAPALAAMADKYGPVLTVWLGMQRVFVVSDPKVVKECFTTHDRALSSRPKTSTGKYLLFDYAGFVVAPYSEYWRKIRKLSVTHLMSSDRLRATEHIRRSEVDSLVGHLYSLIINENNNKGTSVVVAMDAMFASLTLNVTMRIMAGKRSYAFNDDDQKKNNEEEAKRVGQLIKETINLAGLPMIADVIPLLRWSSVFTGRVKAMQRVAVDFEAILASWIQEQEAKMRRSGRELELLTDSPQDVIDVVLSSFPYDYNDSVLGHIPRHTVITGTIMSLILAATETTSTTTTWALANILKHKQVYEQVMEELDRQVGRTRWVQEEDIKNLVYIQAVVKETLRLFPAGPLSIPREANEDCSIAGYHVPKGTWVFVNLLKLHRDPKIWDDPLEFMPERFLVTEIEGKHRLKEEYTGTNSFEYAPFGNGRRACPGVAMANQVMHLALARLLQGFAMVVPGDGIVDMTEKYTIAMQKATPLEVELAPRLLPQLYQNTELH